MKSINKFIVRSAVALAGVAMVSSCSMEEPFAAGKEATLTMTTEIRGDVVRTRAISSDQLAVLRQKCVVYIENNKGVVRKYKGLDNIPDKILLRTGSYVAEAWSGDSVSASFDSKFYRGYQKFEMSEGQNSLTLKCNIANVLVSVTPESLDVNLSDIKVTFWHSRGSLVFTEENIPDAKGYFMMPNADKDLNYKVEGKQLDGSSFVREGVIANVQRAHEYAMTITADPAEPTLGGAMIRLTIADIPVIEEEVEIFSAPAIRGVDYDIADQVISTARDFMDTKVYVRGYFGLQSVSMSFSDNFSGVAPYDNILDNTVISELAARGINVEKRESTDASTTVEGGKVKVEEAYITFSKGFLDALPASDTEYVVTLRVVDSQNPAKENTVGLRIANSENAVVHQAPVGTVDSEELAKDLMAVSARRATLTGYVYDEGATNFGIRYRAQGTSEWNTVYPSSSSAAAARRNARATRGMTRATVAPFSVVVTDLAPGTTYEYQAFCEGFEDAPISVFTTESIFEIPNSSFEEWGVYNSKVVLPGNTGDKLTSFWGSGNEGASLAGKTLTDKSTDMVHSGTYSARLASANAFGVLAAGNIFVGYYDRTDGTNGVLQMGREYNGSHPSKIRVYANYRPGAVNILKNDNLGLVKGQPDHGQIYVALVEGVTEICTNPKNQKLFNENDPSVIAYGQVTWTGNFGPDGQLELVEIPLVYNERAKTKRPTHIVITASAAKFGDYFSGSDSSVMYLDDVELVYE